MDSTVGAMADKSSTSSTAQPTQPVSQPTQSVPKSTQSVPQSTQPVPQSTKPVPQSTKPVPQSTQPVPQSTQPVSQSTQDTPNAPQIAATSTNSQSTHNQERGRQVPVRNNQKVANNRYRNTPKYFQRSYKNTGQPANSPQNTQSPIQNSAVTQSPTQNTAVPHPANQNAPRRQRVKNTPRLMFTETLSANSPKLAESATNNSPQVAQPFALRHPGQQPAAQRQNNGAQPSKQKPKNKHTEKGTKMVIVTDFPVNIQPLDLLNAFEAFNSLKVTKLNARFATIAFDTEDEANAAVELNQQIEIYGESLTIKPYYGKPSEEPKHSPKREFARTKEKSITVDPRKIDLSGDFHSQVDNVMTAVRLTQEDVSILSQLYTDVEYALQSIWPGCKTIPFGSITTGLGAKTSDADCFVEVPSHFRHPQSNFVIKAKRILQHYPGTFSEILCIPRANTPIVKFFHIPTETNCDLTFKTPLGAQNSKLIAFLLHADPRLIPMAVIIKYWAKVHELTGTGKLTNYTLTMMIIFYLQQPPISILPSIAWLQSDPANDCIVDSWNAGFMSQRQCLPPCSNTSSISELLGGFFEYYSLFNFDDMVICPYYGSPLPKKQFKDPTALPKEFDRYKANVLSNIVMPIRETTSICVQDPLEQSHNIASAISSRLAADIRAYFKHAASAYEKEKLNRYLEFLKVILLQGPVLSRPKSHQEYRVHLFPRIIASIVDPDWKSVVREIVLKIFENLLQIKLGKVEETLKPDSRKQKEKYTGQVTKSIWKRKHFSKLYNGMNLDFVAKQRKITEEIMSFDKQTIEVNFNLILTFCHNPASTLITMRIATPGYLDEYREFGAFFISCMQHWFLELVKPHSKPLKVNIAETIKMIDKNAEQAEEANSSDSDVENSLQNQSDTNTNDNGNIEDENTPVKETENLNDECTTQ